ncbi:MAG: response regulator [Syntrophales bacterium]|jgi:putative nucleotidyltransferase with HDIG domain|nr:response regulator [Syntrophales bacterium]MDY0044274.1 response regulator [Syntrophales bacterium]
MAVHNQQEAKSILVVDDDNATRELIIETLHSGGYLNTREFNNGLEAFESFRESGCELIISDLKMPGISGMELLNKVKEYNPSIPVIIVTGYPSIGGSVTAMKKGAVDFLSKPFDPDDLLFKVNLYLKEKSILAADAVDCEDSNWKFKEKIRELSTINVIYDRIETMKGGNEEIFREIVLLALNVTGGDRCLLVLFDETEHTFYRKTYETKSGVSKEEESTLLNKLKGVFIKVISEKKALLTGSDENSDILCCTISVPLMIRNKVFALLTVTNDNPARTFGQKDLSFLQNLTARASLHLENTLLYESLFGSIMDTFESLIHSIHARDHYTERHSQNVTTLALRTARALRLSAYETESLKTASLLHDIGKIAIPDHILLKPGHLTPDEYKIIMNHSVIGENIIKSLALFEEERKIVRHHHERWDGNGYPDGLKKNNIPVLARILSVADSFDAMTSDRPYRKGLIREKAVDELLKNRGAQFDPDIVDAFVGTLDSPNKSASN